MFAGVVVSVYGPVPVRLLPERVPPEVPISDIVTMSDVAPGLASLIDIPANGVAAPALMPNGTGYEIVRVCAFAGAKKKTKISANKILIG
jgi:hypothetical protein